ncbi:hypothetical protein N2603_43255 [Bradyrhizobium huanghuaihaiense]|uniref:hypothetical protein n=1 Tax=Bradyrhizobium huanghuaihaiense TaxID=990078 RepID=UPI0021A9F809|nr:hypothetical protein [Bradyrhizobium sp. CB3035]UWU76607.1 hypothetical protein N2603_43255 [Bradyrhizobium sp. CB3035]
MQTELGRIWWALPGPHSFISDVVDALEEGRSIILALPSTAPTGLHGHLIANVDLRGTLEWKTVDLSGAGRVAQILANELIPLARRPPRAFANDIVLDPGLQATVVQLTGIEQGGRFKEFVAFLAEFLSCVRKSARSKRATPRLLFDLPKALLRNPQIGSDIDTIRLFEWAGRVRPSDMQLYVSTRMQGRSGLGPTNLLERIVVEFAGWDSNLADELSKWSSTDLLHPLVGLQKLARNRDMRGLSWQAGTQDMFGARSLSHILYHVATEDHEEITKRLWRAHVSEVFPWLEEMRAHLIDRFRSAIRLPHVLQNDEIIHDADLLEIGQLHWNLRHLARLPDERLTLVNLCKLARNDLAHRRPVETNRLQLLDHEWKQALGR